MAHPFSVQAATLAASAGETLTGTRVLTEAEVVANTVFTFDPGGAGRNVDLPTASTALAGQILLIHNSADAAEVITIRASSGGATVCTPAQNEAAIVWCTGTTWRGGQIVGS